MEFICFSDWDQLPLSSSALFEKSEKESLFFSRQWFQNLVNTALEDDQPVLLACVVEEGRVLAILPLIKRTDKDWDSLRHLYSSLYTLLLAENDQEEILTCLCQGLRQLPFHSLSLEPVAEDDSNINSLQRAMESCGFICYRYFRFYNWFHRLQGQTFTDYMAARPARVRNTIARKERKLAREHNYEIRLHIGSDVQQAMADYNAIYKSSWKAYELFAEIIEGMVGCMSEPGWPRLAILYIEGQPTAAQLWFVVHRKASIFRLAHDEAWKHYSPGSILMRQLMEYVIDTDKVEEIDFLTGNDRYKQDWMSERRERWGLVIDNRREPEGRVNKLVKSIKGLRKRLFQQH